MAGPLRFELFHRLADPASTHVRKRVTELGLTDQTDFRNVNFESHAQALAAHGQREVPAIWDGERLHVGEAACLAFLEGARSAAS